MHHANTQTTKRQHPNEADGQGPGRKSGVLVLLSATAARLTATAATASQLRRLASERTNEQKGKRNTIGQAPKCNPKANSGESYPQFEPNS